MSTKIKVEKQADGKIHIIVINETNITGLVLTQSELDALLTKLTNLPYTSPIGND